jgi:arylsulfatase
LLKLVDDLGVANNTIVVYTTDNGAEAITWPDGGATPFKGEKATNWEGGFRVPCLIKWPGAITPGTIVNDLCAHEDFIPTFAAAVGGEADLVGKLKDGQRLNGKQFKVHLDGFNLLPLFKGDAKESPRREFLYWSDDGDLMAIRVGPWKASFMEQHAESGPKTPMGPWQGQFTKLRAPMLYNLRADPFERGPESATYFDWQARRMFLFVPAQAVVARYLESFKDFPPRTKPASFSVSDAMDRLTTANSGKN